MRREWPKEIEKRQKKKKKKCQEEKASGSFCFDAAEMNPTGIHKDAGSIPGLAQWVKYPVLP